MRYLITAFLLFSTVVGCQPSTHQILVKQCEDTRTAIGLCEQDAYFVTPPVTARCEQQMRIAEGIAGCPELEQEYLSCVQDFFTHIAQPQDCRPPSPSYRLWLSVDTYCQNVRDRMSAVACPDPL